jgi:anhydro-N-acetylmuramic acid kinase
MLEGKTINGVGVMSGTSLDGIDIVSCSFYEEAGTLKFHIHSGITVEYSSDMYNRLYNAPNLSGYELAMLNVDYGVEIGNRVNDFIKKEQFVPDFIASHGYTVFHNPKKGLTLQIGSGAEISTITNIKTVCDFRTVDVALGGQGAPLVPIGDKLLFGEYDACLNLGGFANISYNNTDEKREAFDICPVNFILNYISDKLGYKYDKDGELGRKGRVNKDLLEALNKIDFYKQTQPKSLGREFVESNIFTLFSDEISLYDTMRTCYEHISVQLSKVLKEFDGKRVLVTGGGVYNKFLIELIKQHTEAIIVIPDNNIIDYKEALIFALLGLLRIENIPNCLQTVTGASIDNIGGAVYL